MNLSKVSDAELARLWAEVMIELRARDLVRSANNPVADFAERIAADHLGLTLVDNKSAKGYDAVDSAGRRYQIKGRRITPQNQSRQLSAIRDLADRQFDFLVAVIFDQWLQLIELWKIPHHLVEPHARYSNHVRAHLLNAKGPILAHPDVEQVA